MNLNNKNVYVNLQKIIAAAAQWAADSQLTKINREYLRQRKLQIIFDALCQSLIS